MLQCVIICIHFIYIYTCVCVCARACFANKMHRYHKEHLRVHGYDKRKGYSRL